MNFRIKKGKHRAWPPLVGLWLNKSVLRRKVCFDFSAKYDLGNNNQEDTNKLFGIGYLWSHHNNSARFGWRYVPETRNFLITAYCYINGKREIREICSVVANRNYLFEIIIYPDGYEFRVGDMENGYKNGGLFITSKNNKTFAFLLGLYFGGNQTAPCDITIKMKKV